MPGVEGGGRLLGPAGLLSGSKDVWRVPSYFPSFGLLEDGANNSTYFIKLSGGLNELIFEKQLEQYLVGSIVQVIL